MSEYRYLSAGKPTGGQRAILEIPNDWTNSAYMLGQTISNCPISTGFSARLPSTVFQRINGIPHLAALSDPTQAAKLSHIFNRWIYCG